MHATLSVLTDAFGQRFNRETLFFEKPHTAIEIFLFTRQFEDDNPFPPGENSGLEDIEDEVVLFRQFINDGLIHNIGAVANDDLSRIHIFLSVSGYLKALRYGKPRFLSRYLYNLQVC